MGKKEKLEKKTSHIIKSTFIALLWVFVFILLLDKAQENGHLWSALCAAVTSNIIVIIYLIDIIKFFRSVEPNAR